MDNQNKSVVYIHFSCAVLNLNIIMPLFISSSYYKFASLFHSMHIFSYTKKVLSLSLNFFFPFYVGFIIIIFLEFLP